MSEIHYESCDGFVRECVAQNEDNSISENLMLFYWDCNSGKFGLNFHKFTEPTQKLHFGTNHSVIMLIENITM